MTNITTLLLVLLLSALLPLSAQVTLERSVIGSLGQEMAGTDLRLSATVGEVAVTTLRGPGLILTQGFHQAELEDLTPVYHAPEVVSQLRAYPNPIDGPLTVELTTPTRQPLRLEITDAAGRLLVTHPWSGLPAEPTTIHLPTDTWPPGLYLLRVVTAGGRPVATTRLVRQ